MAAHRGYLLIADISGYTAYLTSTEFDHANGVIASLLRVLVERLGDPLHLWRLEGDAVLAYTTDENFPDGHTFLTICEGLYSAFAKRRQDIQANTTCTCRACSKVPELDLKLIVHHGRFEELAIGPMRDISGPDVILVHRLTKTAVKQTTGVNSYALFTQAAYEAMGEPEAREMYSESVEHFGEVQAAVYDLAAAWERIRAARQRVFVEEEDAMLTLRTHLPVPPAVAWQVMVSPEAKRMWMGLRAVNMTAEGDRPGPGAHYHCIHELTEFHYDVVDWEPFAYMSNRFASCFHPHLFHHETFVLTPTEGGTDVRYTCAHLFDPADPDAPQPEADETLLELYRPALPAMLQTLASTLADDPASLT